MSKPITPIIQVDIVIFGGGIAGLWLLNRLCALGYSVLLLEINALGKGQTICAQGIIHGGTKYALKQKLTPVAESIASMPTIWQDCLAGQGEIDLSSVTVLAQHQHLWVPNTLTGKFVGFLASKAMRSRVHKLVPTDYPDAFKTPSFQGEVYALNEPVLDINSLLKSLSQPLAYAIRKLPALSNVTFVQADKQITQIQLSLDHQPVSIQAQRYIFSAGAGNADLLAHLGKDKPQMQKRPLHMLMLKGMPSALYAHAVDSNFKPRLTITSHQSADGAMVWYLGGELSVKGVEQTPQELFTSAKQTLEVLLPDIPWQNISWRSFRIDRAEPWQAHQGLPSESYVHQEHNLITAWPVKLAFSPLLAKQVIALLKRDNIKPLYAMPPLPDVWPTPAITPLPWREEEQWNTEH